MRIGWILLSFHSLIAVIQVGPVGSSQTEEDMSAAPVLDRFRALGDDDLEARAELVREDPALFRAAVESLLAGTDLSDPTHVAFAQDLSRAYVDVLADSALVSDVVFLIGASEAVRESWIRAVRLDREGTLLRNRDPNASAAAFEAAIDIYREIGHLRREAVAWGSLGTALWDVDRERAEVSYLAALARRRALGDPLWLGRALNTMGGIKLEAGDYDSALVYYDEARAVREPLGRPGDLASTLIGLGAAHYHQGGFETAETHFNRAIDLAGPESSTAFRAREGLANLAFDRGEYAAARSLYEAILAYNESTGDTKNEARLLSKLGLARCRQGDFAGALADLDRARVLQEESGYDYGLAETFNRTGIVLQELGEGGGAYRAWQAARDAAVRGGHPAELARILMNLGFGMTELMQSEEAIGYLTRAIALCDSLGDPLCSRDARSKLATAFEQIHHDYTGALAIQQELLAQDRTWGNRDAEALDLGNIGVNKLRLGRGEEALVDLQAAVQLSRETGNDEFLWNWYVNIADHFEQTGRLDSAAVYNARAIEALERDYGGSLGEEMKAAYQGERALVYEAQIQVLAKTEAQDPGRGAAESALAVAERGKARAFLDMLQEAQVDVYEGAPPELVAARDSVRHRVDAVRARVRHAEGVHAPPDSVRSLRAELTAGESEERRAEERLRFESPRLRDAAPSRVATIDEIRAALLGSPHSVLLEYSLGDSSCWLWSVTAGRIDLYRLAERGELERRVRTLRESVAHSDRVSRGRAVTEGTAAAGWQAEAEQLYRLLLEPAAKTLEAAQVIYIVPDGALHYLPFEVLLRSGTAGPVSALGGKEVHLAPSATVLTRLAGTRTPAPGPLTCLAVGDPSFAPSGGSPPEADSGVDTLLTQPLAGTRTARAGLAPLPHAREEVEAIASLIGPDASRVLIGSEARESTLRNPGFAAGYRIVHFATHGLVNERLPSRSALVLAYPADPGEDGYLQASEIYGLKLRADLVVLSACETGKGKMVRGEGVLGLPRAFFYAGARNVVVSLWSVSDEATAMLMSRFYEEMVTRRADPALALARAKTAMINSETWNHPFYWAGFVFLGPG